MMSVQSLINTLNNQVFSHFSSQVFFSELKNHWEMNLTEGCLVYLYIPLRIHGTGIFTYMNG